MAAWIKFRGVSSESLGLKILEMPKDITGVREVEVLSIPGRKDTLRRDRKTYAPVELSVLLNLAGTTDIRSVMSWLDGFGDLILSDSADYKRKAVVVSREQSSRVRPSAEGFYDSITVKFKCDPFLYLSEPVATEFLSPGNLTNPSVIEAEPLINIYGSGNVQLSIGNIVIVLNNMSGAVAIDCGAKVALSISSGEFVTITLNDGIWPTLGTGVTAITWSGSVTKVVIDPKWRWL